MERIELNTHFTGNLSTKIDYGLYFHTNRKDTSADNNNDDLDTINRKSAEYFE